MNLFKFAATVEAERERERERRRDAGDLKRLRRAEKTSWKVVERGGWGSRRRRRAARTAARAAADDDDQWCWWVVDSDCGQSEGLVALRQSEGEWCGWVVVARSWVASWCTEYASLG